MQPASISVGLFVRCYRYLRNLFDSNGPKNKPTVWNGPFQFLLWHKRNQSQMSASQAQIKLFLNQLTKRMYGPVQTVGFLISWLVWSFLSSITICLARSLVSEKSQQVIHKSLKITSFALVSLNPFSFVWYVPMDLTVNG